MEIQIKEIISVAIPLFFGFLIFQKFRRQLQKKVKAKEVDHLGNMKIKIHKTNEEWGLTYLNIQCKGLIPIGIKTSIGFIVSVMTESQTGRSEPVLSTIDSFQESKSTAFQDLTKIGEIDASHGFDSWTTIGTIPIEILQPAISGAQKLKITVRLVDMNNLPEITLGAGEGGILTITKDYDYHFNVKGYHEEGSHINEARALSVKLGVAVAMSDGKFDITERKNIDLWIKKRIMFFDQEKQSTLKSLYNKAKNDAEEFFSGIELNEQPWKYEIDAICKDMCNIGEEVQKYEALELAHEVMVADGVECDKESENIHNIARNLDINIDEIEMIRSHKIYKLNVKNK